MIDPATIAVVAAAALAGGAVNAIAGGGSLITFPALVAVGLPAVTASVTNTLAMCPGYLGGSFAQRRDLAGQGKQLSRLVPVSALGGALGAWLLLATGEGSFNVIVPFLILLATIMIAAQGRLRRWLTEREHGRARAQALAVIPVALASIYGGYFGAGMGLMVLAALGAVLVESILRINALKQTIALTTNVAAAIVFLGWGPIDWPLALVMMVGSFAGGTLGGALSAHISPTVLRWLIVVIGTCVSGIYFVKLLV